MSFKSMVRHKELEYVNLLLSIFNVVESVQMRQLFCHLSDQDYNEIIARMFRERMIYISPDRRYMASSELAYHKPDFNKNVLCFWAFMAVKDKITDFASSEPPAVVTISSRNKHYDFIPLTADNAAQINKNAEELPEMSNRYLISDTVNHAQQILPRIKRDFLIIVSPSGQLKTYKL